MEDLDPQVIAALHRAAKGNPELRSAASAIFAALKRRDEREQEAWAIVRQVAVEWTGDGGSDIERERCIFCRHDYPEEIVDDAHTPDCPVIRARALLGDENQ